MTKISRSILVAGVVLSQLLLAGCRSPQVAPTKEQTTAIVVPTQVTPIDVVTPETEIEEAPQATATSDQQARLPEIPFDQFVDEAFAQLLQRDPEWATAEGVAEQVGADETSLISLSPQGIRQTHELQKSLLDQLRAIHAPR